VDCGTGGVCADRSTAPAAIASVSARNMGTPCQLIPVRRLPPARTNEAIEPIASQIIKSLPATTDRSVVPNARATLHIHCAHCGGVVKLRFWHWKPGDVQPPSQSWPCPHCDRENRGTFAGRLMWVKKREADAPR
jgi:hypothetical protein